MDMSSVPTFLACGAGRCGSSGAVLPDIHSGKSGQLNANAAKPNNAWWRCGTKQSPGFLL